MIFCNAKCWLRLQSRCKEKVSSSHFFSLLIFYAVSFIYQKNKKNYTSKVFVQNTTAICVNWNLKSSIHFFHILAGLFLSWFLTLSFHCIHIYHHQFNLRILFQEFFIPAILSFLIMTNSMRNNGCTWI